MEPITQYEMVKGAVTILKGTRLRTFLIAGIIALGSLFSNKVSGQTQFDNVTHLLKSKQSVLGGNVCMLISKDDQVVFEKNLGKYTRNTPEMIASCSKWLTAALIATFIDEGRISPDDTLGKYLPVFSSYGKGSITISQCMSHTSGIESRQITFKSLLERRKIGSLDEEVNSFAAKLMVGKPGKVFSYGNIGLNTVGRILEVISHKDFETLFHERIAIPLGMKSTTFKNGKVVNPSGGAVSTAADYMNFLRMILNKGKFNGKQIISTKTIEQMQLSRTVNTEVIYTPAEARSFEYGWGEWILEKDKAGKSIVLSSPGLFGTFPWIDLVHNYAGIILVKNIQFKDRQKNYQKIREAVNAAIK